jgi:cold shock CspA family protein
LHTGKIVSFSTEKRYGFIKDADGESYFLHQNEVIPEDRKRIAKGAVVKFDAVPTPKGMAARSVVVQENYPIYVSPGSDIIVSKSNACGRNNEAVFSLGRLHVESKSPDSAVDMLKQKARAVGCNAVLNLQRSSRTGRAWTNSNYKFTIHTFSAEIALVKHKTVTGDSEEAGRNQQALKEEIDAIKARRAPKNKSVFDAGGIGVVALVVVALILMIAMAS